MKLIVTLGPSSSTQNVINKLLKYADGVRLNLKHGSYEEHLERIKIVREIEKKKGKYVPIIADIPGAEIRTGDFKPMQIKKGDIIKIFFKKGEVIYIPNEKLLSFLKDGVLLYIDDGKTKLKVINVEKDHVEALVISGKVIEPRKSVSVIGADIKLSIFENPKNKELIKFVIENDIDIIAVSFVQTGENIAEVRDIIRKFKGDQFVMAKIEHRSALKRIRNIIKVSDSIMIARGDLAVEVGLEKLPIIQKKLVDLAIKYIKPVYIATEFLSSLITQKTPTRAEVSDIANAIIDGADGIILTNETAIGKYPIRAARIAKLVIKNSLKITKKDYSTVENNVNSIVAKHACKIAEELESSSLVAETESGFTAVNISRFKPKRKIYVITKTSRIARFCSILWGIKDVKVRPDLINKIPDPLKIKELFKIREKYSVYVGSPILQRKTTTINVFQL